MIHFDIEALKNELKELEKQTGNQDFWLDTINSNKVLSKIKSIKGKCQKYDEIKIDIQNELELIELLEVEYDEEMAIDSIKTAKAIEKKLEKFEIQTLLSGKFDKNNAILTLHPGAGGTEAQDWVEMLYRMYTRWAGKSGFKIEELDYLDGDEAGIKSVTFEVIGENAYGYLKGEMGVHRLVRISPFDSRRQKTYIICFFRSVTRNFRRYRT